MTQADGMGAEDRSVTSRIEVAVDPATAFKAFTEELDYWWVRGPINHHDGGRTLAMRCETGVGGRLLEVYDDASGDALELARITIWEPGRRLRWQSSIDDVETEVRFDASSGGTTVEVIARIPGGGHDRGGTSWVRVVPKWFGAWCTRRECAPRQVNDLARLALAVSYARPAAAARWLAETFGFRGTYPLPEGPDPLAEGEHGQPWIEFRVGNSSLMILGQEDAPPGAALVHVPWVYVDDVAEHYRHSVAAGATIVEELHSPWGLPFYVAADPEGNHWRILQARPTMS